MATKRKSADSIMKEWNTNYVSSNEETEHVYTPAETVLKEWNSKYVPAKVRKNEPVSASLPKTSSTSNSATPNASKTSKFAQSLYKGFSAFGDTEEEKAAKLAKEKADKEKSDKSTKEAIAKTLANSKVSTKINPNTGKAEIALPYLKTDNTNMVNSSDKTNNATKLPMLNKDYLNEILQPKNQVKIADDKINQDENKITPIKKVTGTPAENDPAMAMSYRGKKFSTKDIKTMNTEIDKETNPFKRTALKLTQNLGYILDTPDRNTFINRTLETGRSTATGGAYKSEAKTTGNVVTDFVADMIGSVGGFNSLSNAGLKLGQVENAATGTIAKVTGKTAGNYATNKIANKAIEYGIKGASTGTEFAGLNATETALQGGTLKETTDSATKGFLSGAIWGMGGKALGETSKYVKTELPKVVLKKKGYVEVVPDTGYWVKYSETPTNSTSVGKVKPSIDSVFMEHSNFVDANGNKVPKWQIKLTEALETAKNKDEIANIIDGYQKGMNQVPKLNSSNPVNATTPETNLGGLNAVTPVSNPKFDISKIVTVKGMGDLTVISKQKGKISLKDESGSIINMSENDLSQLSDEGKYDMPKNEDIPQDQINFMENGDFDMAQGLADISNELEKIPQSSDIMESTKQKVIAINRNNANRVLSAVEAQNTKATETMPQAADNKDIISTPQTNIQQNGSNEGLNTMEDIYNSNRNVPIENQQPSNASELQQNIPQNVTNQELDNSNVNVPLTENIQQNVDNSGLDHIADVSKMVATDSNGISDSQEVKAVNVKSIGVDPQRFQFKADTNNSTGTGEKLTGTEKFDKNKAGVVTVWQDNQGKAWVVNGHHRVELANRTNTENVNAIVLKESDGISDKQARTIGALQNIGEGMGTPKDAAQVFKENNYTLEDLKDTGLSTKDKFVEQGYNISKLNDRLYQHVTNENLSYDKASIIGKAFPNVSKENDANQNAVMDYIQENNPNKNELTEAIYMIKVSQNGMIDDVEENQQMSLDGLGSTNVMGNNFASKMKLISGLKHTIVSDKNVFNKAIKNSGILTNAGNVLNTTGNTDQKVLLDNVLKVIDQGKGKKGDPINDILNTYASKIGFEGMNTKAAIGHVTAEIVDYMSNNNIAEQINKSTNAESGQTDLFGGVSNVNVQQGNGEVSNEVKGNQQASTGASTETTGGAITSTTNEVANNSDVVPLELGNDVVNSDVTSSTTPSITKDTADNDSGLISLETEHKANIDNIKKSNWDNEIKQKKLKVAGFEYATNKRELIQGESLETVEGGLTVKELENKNKRLLTNYTGKEVSTPDGNGVVINNAFGKVKVEVTDMFGNKTSKAYSKELITEPKAKLPMLESKKDTADNSPKESYQLTSEEYKKQSMKNGLTDLGWNNIVERQHKNAIADAIIEGKTVPENVKSSYSDMNELVTTRKEQLKNSKEAVINNQAAKDKTEKIAKNIENTKKEEVKTKLQEAESERKKRTDIYNENVANRWTKTKAEYVGTRRGVDKKLLEYEHEEAVKLAIKDGKPVLEEVLKDYPSLSPKTSTNVVEVTSSNDFVTYAMLESDVAIKVHGYRGRALEDGYSGVTRYGKAKYYTNMKGVAETWKDHRGEGAFIEEKDITLLNPFVDEFDKKYSAETFDKLKLALSKAGLTDAQITFAFNPNNQRFYTPFETITNALKENSKDNKKGFWDGSDNVGEILQNVGFDGIVSALRSESTLEFAVFSKEEVTTLPNVEYNNSDNNIKSEVMVSKKSKTKQEILNARLPEYKRVIEAKDPNGSFFNGAKPVRIPINKWVVCHVNEGAYFATKYINGVLMYSQDYGDFTFILDMKNHDFMGKLDNEDIFKEKALQYITEDEYNTYFENDLDDEDPKFLKILEGAEISQKDDMSDIKNIEGMDTTDIVFAKLQNTIDNYFKENLTLGDSVARIKFENEKKNIAKTLMLENKELEKKTLFIENDKADGNKEITKGVGNGTVEEPSTPEEHYKKLVKFNGYIKREKVTAQDIKDQFEYLIKNETVIKEGIFDNLKANPKYKGKRKTTLEKYTNELFDKYIERMIYTDKNVYSTIYDFSGKEIKYDDKRKLINAITDESINKYRTESRAKYEAEKAKNEKSLNNPETVTEFRTKKEQQGLSVEETRTYEDLVAKAQNERADNKAEDKRTKDVEAISNIDDMFEAPIKDTNTKTGEDLWVVKFKNRIEKEAYGSVRSEIKKIGGYYSNFKKGFIFKEDPTESLKLLKEGGSVTSDKVDTSKVVADKLRKLADNMQTEIDNSYSDRQENTSRRAGMAANAREHGDSLKETQAIMNRVSDAIENGEAEHLKGITTRTHIQTLEYLLGTNKRLYAQKVAKEKYTADYTRSNELEKQIRNSDATIEMIDNAEYPKMTIYSSNLLDLVNFTKDIKGFIKTSTKYIKLAEKNTGERVDINENEMKEIEALVKVAQANGIESYHLPRINNVDEYKRLQAMGIETVPQLRAALREFLPHTLGTKASAAEIKQRGIRNRELELSRTKIDGYFPTPKTTVNRMIEEANIKPGDKILEPSAGTGHIADNIKEQYSENKLDVVEYNHSLNELLKDKGHNVVGDDFLKQTGSYDKIIMNPPFEKGQDVDHVMHTYELLKPGGRIVSIMSEHPFFASDKKSVEFRRWLDLHGVSEKLSEGTFNESDRKTGVNTRIVTIDKSVEVKTKSMPILKGSPTKEKLPKKSKGDTLSTNMDMKSDKPNNNFGRNNNIPNENVTNDTMLDGIEFSGKPAVVSKVYSNTLKNTGLLTEIEKDMLDVGDFSYDTRTEQMSLNEAKQRIETDLEGEIESLNNKEIYSGSDVDTMMGILGDDKLVKARETGDYTDTKNWLKNVRKAGTEGGRTVQSFAKYSRTGEGKLIEAQRVINKAEETVKESNPNLIDEIDKQAKTVTDILDTSHEEAAKQTVEELLPESMLAKKINNTLKPSSEKETNLIADMVNELFKSAQESPLPTKSKSSPRNPIEYLKQAIQSKDEYSDTWKKAKVILKDKYKDDSEVSSILNDYFEKGIVPTYSNNTLNRSVQTAMKTLDQKLVDIAKSSISDKEASLKVITDYLVENTNVTGKGIELLGKKIQSRFNELVKTRSDSILKSMFKDKKKTVQKDTFQKIAELINLGAYDKESIRDLIKQKEGLPILESEDIKFITEHMKLANDAIPDNYENRMEMSKVGGLIAEKTPSSNMEKLKAVQRISMLFNPKTTVVRNPLGNALLNTMESVKNIPGAAIDKIVSSIRKSERTTLLMPVAKGKAAKEGFQQGLKEWKLDIINNVDTSPAGGGVELPYKTKIFNENAKTPVQRSINKAANKIHFIVGKALKLGDTPFYNAAYAEKIAELKIIKKSNVITDEMKETAKQYGLERTLQNDSAMANIFTGIKSANFLNKNPEAKTIFQLFSNLIMPFAKTPANVLDKFIDYSPVGILKATAHGVSTRGKGTFDQSKFVNTLARGLTGTGLALIGYLMAKSGLITGARSKNAKISGLNDSLGKGSYAIKFGDTYQTIDWALPASAPLMMGADVYNSIKDSASIGSALVNGAGSGVNLLFNSTLLQGPSRLMGGYNPAASLASGMLGTTTQVTPTIGNQLRQLNDPFVRETYDANLFKQTFNKLINRLPMLSTSLPKKTNAAGEELKTFQGENTIFNVMFNPGFKTTYNPTDVQKEMVRLYDDSNLTDQIPSAVSKTLTKTKANKLKEDIVLTGEQFSEYQKTVGEKTMNAYSHVIFGGGYRGSTDEEKADMLAKALAKVKKEAKDSLIKRLR